MITITATMTRSSWRFEWNRIRELFSLGVPAAVSMFLDIANWWIFVAFIVGRLGAVQLAATTIALSFMHICFLPAVGLNYGISAIVGQWLGRGDVPRAKARTYTAMRIAASYMAVMGLIFAVFGAKIIQFVFDAEADVASLGHKILILAAFFQAFDAVNIVSMGALRGAGDTRWMMYITFITSYFMFLPLAILFGIILNGGALGAWAGTTIFVILLSGLCSGAFTARRACDIGISSIARRQRRTALQSTMTRFFF